MKKNIYWFCGVLILVTISLYILGLSNSGISVREFDTKKKAKQIPLAYNYWLEEYGTIPPASEGPILVTLNKGGWKQIPFLSKDAMVDGWRTGFRVFIGEQQMIVWSAGKDRSFSEQLGSDDDMIFLTPINVAEQVAASDR